jgi:hypothetical protein
MREVIAAPIPGLDLRQHYGHHQSPAVRAGGLLHSMLEAPNMNEVYARVFPDAPPAHCLRRTPSRWRKSYHRMHRAGMIR